MQHAHQKGIIHRDLKPSNILVSTHDGKPVVKVIDFGISKAIGMELTEKTIFTQFGRMIGTPQYMSPEQAELDALNVDTRSDIYSLGVILYELLTGTTPLTSERLRSVAYAEMQRLIREETPPKPYQRLAGLLESNQKMLGDIRNMNTSEAGLPTEFEALRKENQALLDKVGNEVTNQQRDAEEIQKLQQANAQLEKLVIESKDTAAAVEVVRAKLFKDGITTLTANERGQFYCDGELIPFPTLVKALATPPDNKTRKKIMPRSLKVTLPTGAKPSHAVFQSRLKQLADAANRIGLRHQLFSQQDDDGDDAKH